MKIRLSERQCTKQHCCMILLIFIVRSKGKSPTVLEVRTVAECSRHRNGGRHGEVRQFQGAGEPGSFSSRMRVGVK